MSCFTVFVQRLAQVHVRVLASGHRLLHVHSGACLHLSISQNCWIFRRVTSYISSIVSHINAVSIFNSYILFNYIGNEISD